MSLSKPNGELPAGPIPSTSSQPLDQAASLQNSSQNEDRLSKLLEKLNTLESRLNSEAVEKTHLAEEVAALREENLRLQEESATASQQLKRFTEWFFQTIDKN